MGLIKKAPSTARTKVEPIANDAAVKAFIAAVELHNEALETVLPGNKHAKVIAANARDNGAVYSNLYLAPQAGSAERINREESEISRMMKAWNSLTLFELYWNAVYADEYGAYPGRTSTFRNGYGDGWSSRTITIADINRKVAELEEDGYDFAEAYYVDLCGEEVPEDNLFSEVETEEASETYVEEEASENTEF